MIAIIDYGAGNIFSIKNALDYLGEENKLTKDNIPHMGWNELEVVNDCPLSKNLNGQYVYFVHSYQAFCNEENISAQCEYDGEIPALVWNGGTVYGAQFHPEKSGSVGLDILKNFGGLVK